MKKWLLIAVIAYLLSKGAEMAIAVKPGVELSTRPEMQPVRAAVDRVWRMYNLTPTITSGMESESIHKTQIHYQGLAEDYRTHDIPENWKQTMFNKVRVILGSDYDVIFEDAGTANEHLHIEYDPE